MNLSPSVLDQWDAVIVVTSQPYANVLEHSSTARDESENMTGERHMRWRLERIVMHPSFRYFRVER